MTENEGGARGKVYGRENGTKVEKVCEMETTCAVCFEQTISGCPGSFQGDNRVHIVLTRGRCSIPSMSNAMCWVLH